MVRIFTVLFFCCALGFGASGCSEEKTQAQLQAEKVRVFRVKQRNLAIKKYQELVQNYPDSEFAAKARQRLQELGPPTATPAPKK